LQRGTLKASWFKAGFNKNKMGRKISWLP